MTQKKSPNYSLEFKQSSAKLAVESNQPVAQTAKELGINPNTLYTWIDKYAISAKKDNSSENDLQLELRRLRKEIVRLKQERDILKKAAAYFASETR